MPTLIATDAGKDKRKRVTYALVREIVASRGTVMILFGTAWGIAKELIGKVDYLLEPIFESRLSFRAYFWYILLQSPLSEDSCRNNLGSFIFQVCNAVKR